MTSESEPEPPQPGEQHPARASAMLGGAALLAGVAVGVGMGIKMRAGADRVERRMEGYRGAWHQIRGR
jgi:hypothetical protein